MGVFLRCREKKRYSFTMWEKNNTYFLYSCHLRDYQIPDYIHSFIDPAIIYWDGYWGNRNEQNKESWAAIHALKKITTPRKWEKSRGQGCHYFRGQREAHTDDAWEWKRSGERAMQIGTVPSPWSGKIFGVF